MIHLKNSAFDNNPFAFRGENSVLAEQHLGIAGDRVTVMTPEYAACRISGMQNSPWTATGWAVDVRIDGEQIPGRDWTWLPNAIIRSGKRGCWEAKTLCTIPPERNACVLHIEVKNISDEAIDTPITIMSTGSAQRENIWIFRIPEEAKKHFAKAEARETPSGSIIRLIGTANDVEGTPVTENDALCVIACSLKNMFWFEQAEIWQTNRIVEPGEVLDFSISLHLGSQNGEIDREAEAFIDSFDTESERAFAWLESETNRIFNELPKFSSDNQKLVDLYTRSLVTYSLNRWINPNFAVQPFYSTGSVTGGCMCSYLWDYGGGLMLHPLVDPETNKKMIRAFIHVDLTQSYAIKPLDGSATGPWYHINQEKIINMIYFHVLHTGDVSFLSETVDGKTIAEWAQFHACVGDDLNRPTELVDFGDYGKSHLELRRHHVYKGVMPDLNARRYLNYTRAYEISAIAGNPNPILLERAKALKELLVELWDEDAGWYDFIWEGKRDKRYTVQMYKFLNSPVIDEHTREKLIEHLNDREFLSKFGLHSISKLDPAYDQLDIDNGGGGICTLFTMQVVSQLYETGYSKLANDILSRVLWWGQRLPYLGDSCAANIMSARNDTPLQAGISSVSCAQMLIFGMCGISVSFDGSITICPTSEFPANTIVMENMKLCGKTFSLKFDKNSFTVSTADKSITHPIGSPIILE